MDNQFIRLEALLEDGALESINGKRVCVFGLGGVGGHCVDALVRSGITDFVIVDSDVVVTSNLNRQLIASMATIGQKKVDAMEAHILSINPKAKVEKKDCFYLPEKAGEFDFASYDYVVDCIDTVSAKIDIICRCMELCVPVISALGCGNKLNPGLLEVTDIAKTTDDPLAKVLRRELRKRGITSLKVVFSREKPIQRKPLDEDENAKRSTPGSSAFVPSVAGIMMAREVFLDLLKRSA